MQIADEQPHIGIPGIGRCVAVGNVGQRARHVAIRVLVLFCVLRVAVVPGVIQFIAVKAHVQVAVQRIGLFRCQQCCAVCLCQRRHTVLVDQLNVVGVDAEFQCRALAVVVTLGRKNAVQIFRVRRAVGEADIAVRLEHLAADRLNERIGQILRTGLLLDVHVRLCAGLYQRDRRQRKERQQHHADDQLHQRCAVLVFQTLLHGLVAPSALDFPL